ncbi:Short-chain-fatty-acid--CoA ligase [Nonomuraea coxensis DSM 45129]|uniref:Short-chain-fatty-acid--CoA ligase n=1 Tax=Nonomuraea coxensis DSM 45129 TaxID=1122611 RepID=A0ABX8TXT4_9ACTN|nr:AMP-binding protein [Nonomuraea coxensis]QYC40203.1 Short-chain-fatty-acid--CoA ligase [Nonomuraea coxensis DSM 45129]
MGDVVRAADWARRPRVVAPELTDAWRRRGFRTEERIGDLLDHGATRWPDRPAIITARGETSFAELAAASAAVARTLVARGVRPGDAVCWLLPTGPDAVAVAAAIWRIGAISSPIVPLYGPREIRAVLDQIRPAAVVTYAGDARRAYPDEFDEALRDVGHEPAARLLTAGRSAGWRAAGGEGPGALPSGIGPAAPEDPCLVLFTSGTESEPKGVVHSVAGLRHELRTTVTEWGLTFRDRMVMASPVTHITGLLQGFMIPCQVGATAVLMERWDPAACAELADRTGATYMAGATPFLRELLDVYAAEGRDRSPLRQYCCGGAAVPPDLIRRAGELGIAAYRAWGMTELPTATLPNELDPLEFRAETDGRLAPGVELRVVDSSGRDVAPGEAGELLLRGPEMMLGYVREELNAHAFAPGGWFRTGDLGSLAADGQVRITGRLKDVINRGGEKFSAREIEEAIVRHPDVAAVAIIPVPGGRLGERIGAAVVSDREDLTLEEVGRAVTGQGLARHKQPELLRVVRSLPTNPTGKINKAAVVKLFDQGTG